MIRRIWSCGQLGNVYQRVVLTLFLLAAPPARAADGEQTAGTRLAVLAGGTMGGLLNGVGPVLHLEAETDRLRLAPWLAVGVAASCAPRVGEAEDRLRMTQAFLVPILRVYAREASHPRGAVHFDGGIGVAWADRTPFYDSRHSAGFRAVLRLGFGVALDLSERTALRVSFALTAFPGSRDVALDDIVGLSFAL